MLCRGEGTMAYRRECTNVISRGKLSNPKTVFYRNTISCTHFQFQKHKLDNIRNQVEPTPVPPTAKFCKVCCFLFHKTWQHSIKEKNLWNSEEEIKKVRNLHNFYEASVMFLEHRLSSLNKHIFMLFLIKQKREKNCTHKSYW